MNKEELYESLEKLHKGVLSEQEQKELESRQAEDADIAAISDIYRGIQQALKDKTATNFRNKLKRINNQIKEEPFVVEQPARSFNKRKVLGITGTVVVVLLLAYFGLTYFNQKPTPDQLYGKYFNAPSQILIPENPFENQEGKTDKTASKDLQALGSSFWNQVDSLYKRRAYDNAIEVITTQVADIEQDTTVHYPLGMLSLLKGEAEQAVNYFDKMDYPNVTKDWYLALAWLKIPDGVEPARVLLKEIADNPKVPTIVLPRI